MISGSYKYLVDKNHNYNTQFRLFPKSQQLPVFADTPLNLFQQNTWISEFTQTTPGYKLKNITPSSNRISMLEGTSFEISIPVYDPSNLFDPYDDKNVKYVWKKDGATLFEYSSQNNLKGTNTITITSGSCTRDVSGVYELEATNKYGTSTSEPLTIDVINLKYSPYLYKNLIVNGCGEQGLAEWTADSDITSRGFTPYNRNQYSIPYETYNLYSKYSEEFAFTLEPNQFGLARFFNATKTGDIFDSSVNANASYYRWAVKNYHPCLVATDGGLTGSQDNFFPSWNYIDTFNKNLQNQYQLRDIIETNKTYITRDKIKFASYGGKAKSIAYQDIDLRETSNLVDGEVYGIDRLVAHFFAYVGTGITNYQIEYVDENTGVPLKDNMIPTTHYAYVVGTLNEKPPFIPLYAGSVNVPNAITTYSEVNRDEYSIKIKQGSGIKIKLTPSTNDKTDIRLDFLNNNGDIISSELISGPNEKDIWAVKEKFFVPYYIGNLYGWVTDASSQEFWIYSQSYTTINAIRGVDDTSIGVKDSHAEWVKRYHYPLILNSDVSVRYDSPVTIYTGSTDSINTAAENYGFSEYFVQQNQDTYGNPTIPLWYGDRMANSKYDRGAAAFFGVQKDVVVPKGTRTIRANIIFNHTSDVIYDNNPRLKNWYEQEIYHDVYTKNELGERFVAYGNPRCAVTAMHLSLHPNTVQIDSEYPTYNLALSGSVWQKQLELLSNNSQKYNTIVEPSFDVTQLQYEVVTSTIPDSNFQTVYDPNIPLTVTDYATLIGQGFVPPPVTQQSGSQPTQPAQPTGSGPIIGPSATQTQGSSG